MQEERMEKFCQLLPKVELHAHLNGSLGPRTVKTLINLKGEGPALDLSGEKILGQKICYQTFRELQKLTDNVEALKIATEGVIQEFAEDGVKYLEIRSTPRAVPTKREYLNALLSGVSRACESEDIIVKLLLSIDMRRGVEEGMENCKLASELMSGEVVLGVDLSGDPSCCDARQFIPVLQWAQREGLKVSAHLAEIPGLGDQTWEILNQSLPDRIGHGTFLRDQLRVQQLVQEKRVPIECCLTSNFVSGVTKEISDSHFGYWNMLGHPCTICTDDKGLFGTTLSREFYLAAQHFNLDRQMLFNISLNTIDFSFAGSRLKDSLKSVWRDFRSNIFNCEND